jgi:cytochrome oxidase assembly protein ShyY1
VLALLVRPRFWPGHLAMLVCVAIAAGLGLGQYGAWQQHRADAARDLADDPPVALGTLMTGDSPFPGRSVGQPVRFTGQWIGGNVYVSDRVQDGRRGYWVVTALLVDRTRSAMPVVRGWSPTTSLPAPTGTASVTGWLEPTEGSGPVDEDPHDNVSPMMRTASLVEQVDADLYSGFVIARDIPTQEGIAYVPAVSRPGVSATTGLRNIFYAVEWWFFGAFAAFIWWRWCRDTWALESNPPEPDPEDGTGDETGNEPDSSESKVTSA